MSEQTDLLERFDALTYSHQLQDMLLDDANDAEDFPFNVLAEFDATMQQTEGVTLETYDFILVVGFGQLRECNVWRMADTSILIVGFKSDEQLGMGALPPGSQFTPVMATPDGIPTLH